MITYDPLHTAEDHINIILQLAGECSRSENHSLSIKQFLCRGGQSFSPFRMLIESDGNEIKVIMPEEKQ